LAIGKASLVVGRASLSIGKATVSFFQDPFVEAGAAVIPIDAAKAQARDALRRGGAAFAEHCRGFTETKERSEVNLLLLPSIKARRARFRLTGPCTRTRTRTSPRTRTRTSPRTRTRTSPRTRTRTSPRTRPSPRPRPRPSPRPRPAPRAAAGST
jgi:hypothetical protein